MDVDKALAKIGGYRRWNLAMFSFLGIFGSMASCWQGVIIVFLGISPPYHCTLPDGREVSNTTVHWVVTENRWASCEMYSNYSLSNDTTQCTKGWTYDKEDSTESIVSEWDLVCDNDYLSDLSQTIYQAGALIGEMFCSRLIDKYGRKKIFVVSTFLYCLVGSLVAASPNYITFCVLRALTAITDVAHSWASDTLNMEIFDSGRRAFAVIGLQGMWVLNYLILGGLAYFLRDWRHLQLAAALIVLPAMAAIWILPESPMWLVANGQVKEAEKALQDIARYNGVKVPEQLLGAEDREGQVLDTKEHSIEGEKNEKFNAEETSTEGELPVYPLKTLFTNPLLRVQTFVSSLLWFANSLVYDALLLSSPSLPGNIYLTFILGALIEVPAYIISYFTATKWGRRMSTVVFHILAGVVLAVISVIPESTDDGPDLSVLIITLALLGRFSICTTFNVITLYTRELFPTNLRATSGGVCSVPARFGTIAAPFISYAAKRILWVPHLILAVISLIAAGATLIIPETMGTPLPQTIADVEVMYEGHKVCSCQPKRKRTDSTESERTKALEDTTTTGPV